MATTTTYSFLDTNVSISGPGLNATLNNAGSAEGGVTVEMEGDKNTMTIGADGSVMHNLRASQAGTGSIRLLKTSPANGILVTAYNSQTVNSALHGKNVLTIVNANRGESITLTGVAFKKLPNLTYAMEGGENEWTFDAARVDMNFTSAII